MYIVKEEIEIGHMKHLRLVKKKIKQMTFDKSTIEVIAKGHIKIKFDMKTIDGRIVRLQTSIGSSPRDRNWEGAHRLQMKRMFRENNIDEKLAA